MRRGAPSGSVAGSAEADRVHAALRRSFEALVPHVDGATFEVRDGYVVATCPRLPLPLFNGIWLEGPDDAPAVRDLERIVGEFAIRGLPCWISARSELAPASRAEATRIGFVEDETLPAMVATPGELVAAARGNDPPAEVVVVREEDGLREAHELAAAGFGAPPEMIAAVFTREVLAVPGLSIVVAHAGGRAVATATGFLADGSVGIFNVATPAEHRGHGYATAATARAVLDGFAAGADLAWLQASAMGEPVYRRMGFRQVGTYVIMGRPAGDG